MIPADLASHLRLTLPPTAQETPQPVLAVQKINDLLSNLVPGQRIMAEIQAQLPNGAYRAIVSQREITLALPFSAKAGDTLELEVSESDGKVTLAFVANRSTGEQAGKPSDSVATTLSQTGKLIGNLMDGISEQGKRASPAPLNGNLPLVDSFPDQAANLAPILKEALTKSGVFYEAHQARWVAGELPTAALRDEPQGKMPPTIVFAAAEQSPAAKTGDPAPPPLPIPVAGRMEQAAQNNQSTSPIPRELTPIVQQQLDALATQNYAWQGQIWPGQKMWWEISENSEHTRSDVNESAARWQTRLKLSLPALGGIDAVLRLHSGGAVEITLMAESEASETRLRENSAELTGQLEAAGLNLTQLLVQHGKTAD